MRAKEYLLQIKKLDTLIDNKLTEVEHWKAIASGIGSRSEGERVQSTGNKQTMAEAVARYMDMEAEINADIDRLVDIRQEVIATIEKLDMTEYDILHKIYVQGLELWETADCYEKSYSWVTTIHGRALANLQKILNERDNNNETSKET
jgi:DNA-directed RNA polymerase specialized sigma subunit